MKYFDSHCHIDLTLEREVSQEEIDKQISENNIIGIIQIGASNEEAIFSKKFAHQQHPYEVYYTIGQHPGEVDKVDINLGLKFAEENKADEKFVAIGEVGLEYHYSPENKKQQQNAFIQYIQKANELNKPLCVHTRDAFEDTLQILKEYAKTQVLIHCFTGDKTKVKEYLNLGYNISFVTFKNAKDIQEAAIYCPNDKILIETDSPYLAPTPYRGRVNLPAYVKNVGEFIANLKNIPSEEFSKFTIENTRKFYNI